MSPAETVQRLYNALPPADRDLDGVPDLWEKPLTLEEAEQICMFSAGGELDMYNGRLLRLDMRRVEDGTETFAGYDEVHGEGAAARALAGP